MGLYRRRSWARLTNSFPVSVESFAGSIKSGEEKHTSFTFAESDCVSSSEVEGGTHGKRCKAAV